MQKALAIALIPCIIQFIGGASQPKELEKIMSADWEDGMDGEDKPTSYVVPQLEVMAALMIGINYAKQASGAEYDFPATLEQMIRRAADGLDSAGCCANRPNTGNRDGKLFGIATEITGRIAAKSERIAIDMTGYTNDAVINSAELHRAILNVIQG